MNNATDQTIIAHPIVTGYSNVEQCDRTGIVVRWQNRADRRATVRWETAGGYDQGTLTECTLADGSDAFPTTDTDTVDPAHAADVADAVADAVAEWSDADADAVPTERDVITAPDGSRTIVYSNGRTIHYPAPSGVNHLGRDNVSTFGARGVTRYNGPAGGTFPVGSGDHVCYGWQHRPVGTIAYGPDGSPVLDGDGAMIPLPVGTLDTAGQPIPETAFGTVNGAKIPGTNRNANRDNVCRSCRESRIDASGQSVRDGSQVTAPR